LLLGAEVIACSCDSHFVHQEFAKKPRDQGGLGGMQIPMIADMTKQISKDYGVLLKDDSFPLRATFIIDGNGVLRHSQYNDTGVGRNIDEVLRLVQAFQHNDKVGEVCPAKWKPGAQGMDPSHGSEKTKKYWKQEHTK
jgi:alkyl hydroperoxide reductase subunit AhpC